MRWAHCCSMFMACDKRLKVCVRIRCEMRKTKTPTNTITRSSYTKLSMPFLCSYLYVLCAVIFVFYSGIVLVLYPSFFQLTLLIEGLILFLSFFVFTFLYTSSPLFHVTVFFSHVVYSL